jgi:hypothetical protein
MRQTSLANVRIIYSDRTNFLLSLDLKNKPSIIITFHKIIFWYYCLHLDDLFHNKPHYTDKIYLPISYIYTLILYIYILMSYL